MQTLLSYPLRKDGYHVTSALDGSEALQRFDEARFDLVILDLMLPKLDGVEVCRQLRSRSQVPIIMLTAKGSETDKVAGLEVGADDYITKPFSMREFRSRVKAALRRSRMVGDAPGRGADRARRADDRLRPPHRSPLRGEEVRRHLRRVRDPRRARPLARAGSSAARPCSSTSGATPSTATRAPSTSTSATCARSSSATRRSPSTCSRCAASATASRNDGASGSTTAGQPDHDDLAGDRGRHHGRRSTSTWSTIDGAAPAQGQGRSRSAA